MTASDTSGNDYKTMTELKWDITEAMPTIEEMEDDMFSDYLDDLNDDKTEILAQIEALAEGEDSGALEVQLSEIEAELELACSDPRADCIDESLSSSTSVESDAPIDYKMIALIGGIILAGLVIGLMFSRRNNGEMKIDPWNDTGWNPNLVPAHDTVANSMYGGAQAIFQQPVAVAPAQQIAGPHCHPADYLLDGLLSNGPITGSNTWMVLFELTQVHTWSPANQYREAYRRTQYDGR